MKTPLTMKHLNTVCAVQDYARFLRSYHCILLEDRQYDWYSETQSFYNKLDLPEGMNTSLACFDAVIRYPIEDKTSVEQEELPKRFTFGY